jgi:hypothetical protein
LNFCLWKKISLFPASTYLYIYVSTVKRPTYIHRKWNSKSSLQVTMWPFSHRSKTAGAYIASLKHRGAMPSLPYTLSLNGALRQLCHPYTSVFASKQRKQTLVKIPVTLEKRTSLFVNCSTQMLRSASVLSRRDGESETCQRAHSERRCFMSRVEVSHDPHPASCLVGSNNGQCQGTFCYLLRSFLYSIKSSPVVIMETPEFI